MKLTAKQERFAQGIADGMNQSDAYRAAYNAGGMKDSTINVKASVLMADGKVRERADELKAALAEKALWTREDSVLSLAAIARGGESRPGEIVSAIKELNLMHGFNAAIDINLGGKVITVVERHIVKASPSNT